MIVQRLTFSTGNQTLPVVDESDLFLTDNIERAAVRHWILDGSENQYISKVKRGTLTVVGSVASASSGVTTSGSSGYLDSDVADPSDQMTICMVVKMPVARSLNTVLASNFKTSPVRGALLTLTGSDLYPKIFISDDNSHQNAVLSKKPVSASEYFVVIASKDFSSVNKLSKIYAAGEYVDVSDTGVDDVTSEFSLSFGWSAGLSDATYEDGPLEISEIIVFDKSMARSEMIDLAYRCRLRGLQRGLSVSA